MEWIQNGGIDIEFIKLTKPLWMDTACAVSNVGYPLDLIVRYLLISL